MQVRLAFRREGNFWNAYLALPDTMDDAKLVGSIAMGAVEKKPDLKRAFMDCMKMMLADAIVDVIGKPPEKWEESPAPESERPGHG